MIKIKKSFVVILLMLFLVQIGFSQTIISPSYSNISYGEHSRNVLDLWISEGDSPRPLLVYIHGGGWLNGDKDKVLEQVPIMEWLDKGVSVASINYRYTSEAALPSTHLDIARAIQFLRYKANDYNLDPSKVGIQGGSAGGCAALWILFHDDLADSSSLDPVLRESTRVQGAIGQFPQTSIDPILLNEWIGENAASHPMIYKSVGATDYEDLIDNYNQYKPLIDEFSPINHLDSEDPPLFLTYPGDMALPALTAAEAIHHKMFGVKLIEEANKVDYNIELCMLSEELNIGSLDEAKFLMEKVLLTCEVSVTGTLTASPEIVTDFTNGLGSTLLTVSTQNSPRMLVTLVRTLPNGTVATGPTTIIQNNNASGTWDLPWIVEGQIHTFTLHTGETDSSVLGDILDTVVVYRGASLGIEDTKINDIALDVFPNPVVEILHIETSSEIQALQIYTITGQKLKEVTIDSSKNATIDLSDLEQQVCIVKVKTSAGVVSRMFVKK